MATTQTGTTVSADGDADTPTSGPMGRVVAASLAVGVVGALVTTLLITPGASEHTITGGALLAFAAGWAALYGLSARFTSEPQRWARVPAAGMAATGAALIALAPGQTTITRAGWVWPPALLALSLWAARQVRRQMSSRARWVVISLLGAIAASSCGGLAETLALHRSDVTMPGQRYDIGGRSLHLSCSGTGSPTVVLVSGTGEMSASWARVQTPLSETTRVCAYDRAGQGWSDDAPHPQDAVDIAKDLHALLVAAGENGPFVLAGHSLGGVYSMAYAARYPTDVAGMVLLDSSSPQQFTALPDYPLEYQMMRRLYSVAPAIARLGVLRLLPTSALSSAPQPAAAQVSEFETSSRGLENARDEVSRFHDAFRQAAELRTLGSKPLVVLTASGSLQDTKGWAREQDQLARLSTNTARATADSSHAGVVDSASGSASATEAVLRAVEAVRIGAPLAQLSVR
jgi:pimeloyl-ACP methyl ester carboxylesterase